MKRTFTVMLAICLLVGIFSGVSVAEDVVLELWHVFPEGAHFWPQAAEMWNEKYGDQFRIELRFVPQGDLRRELSTALMTGTEPDLVTVDNPHFASFAEIGAFADITDKVEQWGKAPLYFEGSWESVMYNDRVYGLPIDSNTLALFYNKDMFREVGLDPEKPPTTWSELAEYAERLTDVAQNRRGITFCADRSEEGTFQFLPFIQQGGADIDNINAPGAVEALALWTTFVKNGWASPEVISGGQQASFSMFAEGHAAMAINGPWVLYQLDDADFEWGLTLLPVKDDVGIRSSALGGFNLGILDSSPYTEQAWEFVQWLHEDDVMIELYWNVLGGARIPPRTDIANLPGKWIEDEVMAVFIDQLQYAKPRGPHPQWPQISAVIQTAIHESLTGIKTPQQALDDAAVQLAQFFK